LIVLQIVLIIEKIKAYQIIATPMMMIVWWRILIYQNPVLFLLNRETDCQEIFTACRWFSNLW
jgi:hypothetical protein